MQLAKLKRLAKKNVSGEKEEGRREVKQVVIDKVTVIHENEKVSSSVEEKNLADWNKVVKLVDINLENVLAPSSSGQYSYWWSRFKTFCNDYYRRCL